MNELAKDLVSSVALFVRVIASGWACLGLLLVVLDDCRQQALLDLLKTPPGVWLVLGATALGGVCAYGLYMSLENLLLMPVLLWIRWRFPDELPRALQGWRQLFSLQDQHLLFRERKARYCASDGRVRELQSRLDGYYAWLIFLYCFAELAVVLGMVLHWQGAGSAGGAFAAGLLAFYAAFCADVFVTREEFWLIRHYRQW